MSARNGLRGVIFDMLPDSKPGLTYEQIEDALFAKGNGRSHTVVAKVLYLLRKEGKLNDDGKKPRRYWGGVKVTPDRPVWTFPGPQLLALCRAGRDEIERALRK